MPYLNSQLFNFKFVKQIQGLANVSTIRAKIGSHIEAQEHTHTYTHCSASCCLSTLLLAKFLFLQCVVSN